MLLQLLKYAQKKSLLIIVGSFSAACLGIATGLPTFFIKTVIDDLLILGSLEKAFSFFLLFLGIFVAKAFFMYSTQSLMYKAGNSISCMIRKDFFDLLINANIEPLHEVSKETLTNYFLTDIHVLQNSLVLFFRQGIKSMIETIFLIGIAWYRNSFLTYIALTTTPLLFFFFKQNNAWLKKYAHKAQESFEALHTYFQEVLYGLHEVKIYGNEEYEKENFKSKNQAYFNASLKSAHYESLIPSVIEFFIFSALCFSLYIGSHQIHIKTLTVGEFSSFFMALLLAYQPLRRLVAIIAEIQIGLASADRIFTMITKLLAIQEIENEEIRHLSFKKKIILQNISYSYQKNHPVLKNINLTIHQGDRIAIIGESGAGKSTLCKLLLGFLTATEGSIVIDEQKLCLKNKKSWRTNIAYISQHPFIFNEMIKNNIIYGNIKKRENIYDLEETLKQVGLLNELQLTDNKILHLNSKTLSGGQKQRLILARAFYSNRPILIFDEATSAIDRQKEKIIAMALETLPPHMTIIIIAHSPLLIEKMRRVITIKNGALYENKKHLSENTLINNQLLQ